MVRRMRPVMVLAAAAAACSGTAASSPHDGGSETAPVAVEPPPVTAPDDAPEVAGAPGAAPCPEPDDPAEVAQSTSDQLTLIARSFTDLPAWTDDRHAEAIPAFLASCDQLATIGDGDPVGVDGYSGKARQWRAACRAAAQLPPGDHAAARAFFEAQFAPYEVRGKDGPDGKMTGYYVETLRASRTRHGAYQVPIYGRPPDLLSVDLTRFVKDARGRRVWGRIDPKTGALEPYHTRTEIKRGALDGLGLEILWADDPVSVLFMEIEGSGKATLDDGSVVWLEFDGKNGRSYRGVGKLLRSMGELQPGEGTMQGIRAWFARNPGRIDEIIDQNPSKVFFKISSRPGAVGSQDVILTARRSMAIDRAFIARSTPVWVDTRAPVPGAKGSAPWRQLLIAQDTGGGILGAVRGDVYWGDDDEAAELGGRMGGAGRYWILLPKAVKVPRKVLGTP
jgi:membrane-bound lytic murein transglycosylase A